MKITIYPESGTSAPYIVAVNGEFAYDCETIAEAFEKALAVAEAHGVTSITYHMESQE